MACQVALLGALELSKGGTHKGHFKGTAMTNLAEFHDRVEYPRSNEPRSLSGRRQRTSRSDIVRARGLMWGAVRPPLGFVEPLSDQKLRLILGANGGGSHHAKDSYGTVTLLLGLWSLNHMATAGQCHQQEMPLSKIKDKIVMP